MLKNRKMKNKIARVLCWGTYILGTIIYGASLYAEGYEDGFKKNNDKNEDRVIEFNGKE